MTKKIAWITDSTSGLTQEQAKELGVYVLPLSVVFDDGVYKDGIDLTNEEFYEKLSNSKNLPSSSQPSTGEAIEFYEELKKEYDMGIAVHISSKLSGTLQGSMLGASSADFPLEIIDSKAGATPLITLIKIGKELEKQGKSIDEIKQHLNDMADKVRGYLLIGNLDQLKKGGRVSNTEAFIGNLLKLNLIVKLEDGLLHPFKKIRTSKKAEKQMLDILFESLDSGKNIEGLHITHSLAEEKALNWKNLINEKDSSVDVGIAELCTVMSVHGGKGTLAMFWFEN